MRAIGDKGIHNSLCNNLGVSNAILKFCSDTDSMLGLKHRYTLKTSENPKVDFATYEWFRQERFKETSISVKLR